MKRISKTLALLLVLTLLLSISVCAYSASDVSVTASSAIAMDYTTGEILYAKDIDTMRVPASMTKIMTAYIIYQELESGNITKDTLFYISDEARAMSRDSSYPTAVPLSGDYISVEQLLQLILVPSASASCFVAAENIAGSEAAFVERMNATAVSLGMKAEYKNCHGARVHYITARSLAILIRDFISRYPDILNYTSRVYVTYNGTTYTNTNKLLSSYYYEGADGFKTGTITESGYCLSSTAHRDGRRIITVVMNSASTADRHTDSQRLLDFGFYMAAELDLSRNNAQVDIYTPSDNPLRVGADMELLFGFSNISEPFENTFTAYVDGKAVETFSSTAANGTVFSVPVNLGQEYAGRESVPVTLEYQLSNGTARTVTQQIKVSDEKAPSFRDIAYHWAEKDIESLTGSGYINGYTDGTFKPNASITRAEFAKLIVNATSAVNTDPSKEPADDNKIGADIFSDISGHWAEKDILTLASHGIVEGSGGLFQPDSPITRQEAAVIAGRLLKEKGSSEKTFTDSDKIASWATEALELSVSNGIIGGYEDGSFRPEANISRAESAVILERLISLESEMPAA